MAEANIGFDFDQIVIGSGFGGAVSALRLSEKGYRTLVLERGRRWASADFPKTNFDLRKFIWWPRLGLTGFFTIAAMLTLLIFIGEAVRDAFDPRKTFT